jgi:ankyrin repeat protein
MLVRRFGVIAVALALGAGSAAAAESSARELLRAVQRGDRAAVLRLLDQRADANARDETGTSALHWAIERGDAELTGLLIRRGADVQARNRYGVPPVFVAATTGSVAIMQMLLEAGASANTSLPEGETVLLASARTGRGDVVELLLARGAKVNASERWREQTALMWAAAEGHAGTVRLLASRGADVKMRSKGGLTALLFAVRGGHLDAVRALLAAGASVGDVAADGTSALALAIVNAHYDVAAELLQQGADPNAPDPRGSALHALAWMRNPGYATAPPRIPRGQVGSLELARLLLARRANPNARITWKEIRFDRDLGVVKSPPNIPIGRDYLSYVGATPFYIAAKGADLELMRLLAEHGADPTLPTVQQVTPLMAAAGLGFWDGESPGPESGVPESQALEAVRLTLALGNDVDAVTDYGPTPVEGDGLALLHRHPLNLGSFGDEALGDMRWGGSTALHGAALRGADAIVRFLVESGARVDARNRLGWTPLMVADGIFVANTEKRWPTTVALLRELEANAAQASGR